MNPRSEKGTCQRTRLFEMCGITNLDLNLLLDAKEDENIKTGEDSIS